MKRKKRVRVLFDEDCAVESKQPALVKDDDILEATPPTCSSIKKMAKTEDTPLPDPFPFPTNFRPDVHACLAQKRMTKSARANYFSSVAYAMFQFKRYPTRDDFVSVSRQIIEKYPFLGSVGLGTSYVSLCTYM